jgi:molybdopterin synthase sulfur carrier subunit
MHVKLLAFAQARDQLGFDELTVECEPSETARGLLARLAPAANLAATMRVAVDCEYRGWEEPIGESKEIAVIPPVSGG